MKKTINKTKKLPTEWKKIFANDIYFGKGLISKNGKGLIKLNTKNTNNLIKKMSRELE